MARRKNSRNYMRRHVKYMDNPRFKILVFNERCFIDINALFDIVMPQEPERFPEKPFRGLIPVLGDMLDPNRKLPEGIRYQLSFFIFAVLFHQVGDSDDLLKDNKEVIVCAVASWPWGNPQTKKVERKAAKAAIRVKTMRELLKRFHILFGYGPRSLGKKADNFFAHSLEQMETRYKKPSQYSHKIQNHYFLRKVEVYNAKGELAPEVEFYRWSLEKLHLMLPILQTCDYLSDLYPEVREILTIDKRVTNQQKRTGQNVSKTQNEVNKLLQENEFLRFVLAKAALDFKGHIEDLVKNKNKTDKSS